MLYAVLLHVYFTHLTSHTRQQVCLSDYKACLKGPLHYARRVCGIQQSQISSVSLICMGSRRVHLVQCQLWEPVEFHSYKCLRSQIISVPFMWATSSYALVTPYTHTHTHTLSLFLTQTHILSLSLSLSLTHTHVYNQLNTGTVTTSFT